MFELLRNCWSDDEAQDIAEYAVMFGRDLGHCGWHHSVSGNAG
jgi:hypothetical protein